LVVGFLAGYPNSCFGDNEVIEVK
jgi:predicted RNA-binding Zn-ribbon protein involved in translation (DUF1610 family)